LFLYGVNCLFIDLKINVLLILQTFYRQFASKKKEELFCSKFECGAHWLWSVSAFRTRWLFVFWFDPNFKKGVNNSNFFQGAFFFLLLQKNNVLHWWWLPRWWLSLWSGLWIWLRGTLTFEKEGKDLIYPVWPIVFCLLTLILILHNEGKGCSAQSPKST
jgi:hypothetical protein